ncbi:MAG: hypothetical protein PHW74_13165 [Desulfobacca sp.]|nr:hypothetical protein [Desulfobacca sp.]
MTEDDLTQKPQAYSKWLFSPSCTDHDQAHWILSRLREVSKLPRPFHTWAEYIKHLEFKYHQSEPQPQPTTMAVTDRQPGGKPEVPRADQPGRGNTEFRAEDDIRPASSSPPNDLLSELGFQKIYAAIKADQLSWALEATKKALRVLRQIQKTNPDPKLYRIRGNFVAVAQALQAQPPDPRSALSETKRGLRRLRRFRALEPAKKRLVKKLKLEDILC